MLSKLLYVYRTERIVQYPLWIGQTTLSVADSATQVTQTPPSPTRFGDIMFAVVCARGDNQTINTPDGWSIVPNSVRTITVTTPDFKSTVFSKIAGSNESSPYTFTIANANTLGVVIFTLRNQNANSPINASGSTTTNTNVTITAPSINTTQSHTLLLFIAVGATDKTISPNGALIEKIEQSGGTNLVKIYVAIENNPLDGSTGVRTATYNAARDSIGILVAIRGT